jgi:hypothetical protein
MCCDAAQQSVDGPDGREPNRRRARRAIGWAFLIASAAGLFISASMLIAAATARGPWTTQANGPAAATQLDAQLAKSGAVLSQVMLARGWFWLAASVIGAGIGVVLVRKGRSIARPYA